MSSSVFLDDDDLIRLTGRRTKSRQIEMLKASGVPFRVNATGHPVVTRAAVEGRELQPQPEPRAAWTPKVIAGGL